TGIPRDKFFGGCRSVAAVSKNEAYAAGSKDLFGEMKNGSSRFVSLPVVSKVAVVGGELYLATTDGIQKTSLPLGATVAPSMVALGEVDALASVGGTLMASFVGGALATVSGPKAEMLAPRVNRLVLSGLGGTSPDDLFAVGLDADGTAEPLHLGKSGSVSMRSDAGLPADVRELQVLADGTVFARTKAGGLFQRSASPLPVAPVPLPTYTAAASIDGAPLNVTAAWGFSDVSTYHPAEYATMFVTATPRAGRNAARPIAFRGRVPLQGTFPATGFCASSDVEAVLEPDVAITYKTCKYAFTKRTAAAVDVHFEGMLTANGAPATYAFDVSLELPR
ncbi:MAG: hypothetical protein HOO96_15865, partial [Polyangiaceae bacterium]|nr:hypothetical protein [Polyangiaceae bacterium]